MCPVSALHTATAIFDTLTHKDSPAGGICAGSVHLTLRINSTLALQVAVDEASHFQFLQERLETLGSWYGALPVHDGLWESAEATAHSLPARLAVESCVHEARGLDRLPLTIQKFRNSKDAESVELLERIYQVNIDSLSSDVL